MHGTLGHVRGQEMPQACSQVSFTLRLTRAEPRFQHWLQSLSMPASPWDIQPEPYQGDGQ